MTLNKLAWPKVLVAIVAAVIVALFVLFQFTTFQVPENLFSEDREPRVGGGLTNVKGSGVTRNNLDELNDIMQGRKQIDGGPSTSAGEGGHADQ
ncbi:hypothetical protein [Nitratireductor sp. XY-223]|uniref:hypothetical protein n=1 Tax=Nitratireductor sp. XY-223 TaxID=2561926 RepID=UPI0010A9EADB|nr:hypothetical protein [Nitratireductor sp. XY-223]